MKKRIEAPTTESKPGEKLKNITRWLSTWSVNVFNLNVKEKILPIPWIEDFLLDAFDAFDAFLMVFALPFDGFCSAKTIKNHQKGNAKGNAKCTQRGLKSALRGKLKAVIFVEMKV